MTRLGYQDVGMNSTPCLRASWYLLSFVQNIIRNSVNSYRVLLVKTVCATKLCSIVDIVFDVFFFLFFFYVDELNLRSTFRTDEMVCLKWDIKKHVARLKDHPYKLWYQLVGNDCWTPILVNDIFYNKDEMELPAERAATFPDGKQYRFKLQAGKQYRFKLLAFFKDSNDSLHGITEVTLAGKHNSAIFSWYNWREFFPKLTQSTSLFSVRNLPFF